MFATALESHGKIQRMRVAMTIEIYSYQFLPTSHVQGGNGRTVDGSEHVTVVEGDVISAGMWHQYVQVLI